MNDYVDVFISHQQRDTATAQRLRERVQSLGYSCYLDVADAALQQQASAVDLATRIRSNLRRARCLLFLSTTGSPHSKWMPWELGFFDGRWGSPTIGLYVHEAPSSGRRRRRAPPTDGREASDGNDAITLQEYLEIYTRVTDETLPDFLAQATSDFAFSNRQDVDVDRFMTLLTSAARNPVAFQIGCLQYAVGMLRPLAQANPALDRQMETAVEALRALRAAAVQPPSAGSAAANPFAAWLQWARQAHDGGQQASAVAREDRGAEAPAAVDSNPLDAALRAWQDGWAALGLAGAASPDALQRGLDLLRDAHQGGVAASALGPR